MNVHLTELTFMLRIVFPKSSEEKHPHRPAQHELHKARNFLQSLNLCYPRND